jgi:AcrR family transcriptional regulator
MLRELSAMGRRNLHSKDELRELFLGAAESIVTAEGLPGINARRVAAAVGYTAGSLYLVFDNLDELILQVNMRTLDALREAVSAAAAGAATPAEQITAIGRAYVDFALAEPQRWLSVFEHRLPRDAVVPSWYRAHIDGLFALATEALSAGQRAVPLAEVTLGAHALWAGVHGICVLALSGKLQAGWPHGAVEMADCLLENFLRGFRARE